MAPLRDKKYLAEITGMSVDYWDEQCAKQRIPFTRFGRYIRFTDEQIEQIIAAGKVEPKRVPDVGQLATKRAQRLRRAA